MSTETGTSLRVSRVISANPAAVFRAWTEPDQLKQWSCPEGMTVADVQVDLAVGGRYRIRMRSAEGKVHTAVGVYREIERPHRLVYSWDWEEEETKVGETRVTADLGAETAAPPPTLRDCSARGFSHKLPTRCIRSRHPGARRATIRLPISAGDRIAARVPL